MKTQYPVTPSPAAPAGGVHDRVASPDAVSTAETLVGGAGGEPLIVRLVPVTKN
jgi:hypothetical protein